MLSLWPITGSPLQLLFWAQEGSQGLWSTEECGPTALRKLLLTGGSGGGGPLILTKGTALGWKFTQCTLKLTLRGI